MSGALCAVQVAENGEYTAVAIFAVADVEFHEDVADVGFDGACADHESVGDGGIGETLCHEFEHVAFAFGEASDRTRVSQARRDWRRPVGRVLSLLRRPARRWRGTRRLRALGP